MRRKKHISLQIGQDTIIIHILPKRNVPPFPTALGSVIHKVGQQKVILTTPCRLPGEAPRSGQCDFSALLICFLVISFTWMAASGEWGHIHHTHHSALEPQRAQNRVVISLINANPKVALTQWIEFHLGMKVEDGGGDQVGSAQNPLPLGRVDVKAEVPGQDHNDGEMWAR